MHITNGAKNSKHYRFDFKKLQRATERLFGLAALVTLRGVEVIDAAPEGVPRQRGIR